jgi:peptidoglycan/LPS O-acetylase OafA/YrhL
LSAKAESSHAFLGLDALRGVAALMIVIGHAEVLFGFRPGSGYLAVDLFFVLSGFVLAYAYDRRIAGGMTTFAFMRVRLIRLYPLYFLGLAVASAGILLGLLFARRSNWAPENLAESLFFSIGFLPTPPGIAPRSAIYPLNTPAWSLAFELVVNLAFVVAWNRISIRVLAGVIVASGLVLIGAALHYGSLTAGSDWPTVLGGFPRVFFSFPVGVLLFRLRAHARPAQPFGAAASLILMIGVLGFEPSAQLRPAYDLVCVLAILPLLVVIGARAKASPFDRFYGFLGGISYALYALHFPIFEISLAALKTVAHQDVQRLQPWAGIAFVAVMMGIAYAADVFFDAPVRRWMLGKRLKIA